MIDSSMYFSLSAAAVSFILGLAVVSAFRGKVPDPMFIEIMLSTPFV